MILTTLLLLQAVSPTQVQNVERDAPLVRAAFDARLLDYPSARFRDVHVTANPKAEAELGRKGRGYLCGFVNSKNRMGAYVGWQRFMTLGPDLIVEGDSLSDLLIDGSCGADAVMDPVDRSGWVRHR